MSERRTPSGPLGSSCPHSHRSLAGANSQPTCKAWLASRFTTSMHGVASRQASHPYGH
ncbi:hypothetical protein Dimus_007951, partial [Dionaea muscipula]